MQLRAWEAAALDVIPREVLAVYKVLGGAEMLIPLDSREDACVLTGLEWSRALAMLFWYGGRSDGKLSSALATYVRAAELGVLRAPFSDDADPCQHALFSLLQTLLAVEAGADQEQLRVLVCNVLQPSGFSGDAMDYRGPYLLLVSVRAQLLYLPSR